MISFRKFAGKCLKSSPRNISNLIRHDVKPTKFSFYQFSRARFFSSEGSRTQIVDDMVRWMKENGANVDDVAVKEDAYGQLGLFASRDFSKGDIVMKMPSRLALSLDSEPKSKALYALIDSAPVQLSDFKLGLKLLSEKYKKDSFWSPYIHSLPDHFLSTLTFSEEALDVLNYPPLIVQAGLHQKIMEDFISKKMPSILENCDEKEHPFSNQSLDLTCLKWCFLAVSSRAFGFSMEKKVMLPLMDMANHSFNPSVRSKKFKNEEDPSQYQIGLVANDEIKSGQSLEINYGNLPNDDFAFLYGFFVADNPFDKIEFGRDTSFFDDVAVKTAGVYEKENVNRAVEIIQKFELNKHEKGPMLTIYASGLVDGPLLGAIRLLLCKKYDSATNLTVEELSLWKCPPEIDVIANKMAQIHIFSMLKGILQNMIAHKQFMSSLFEGKTLEDTKLGVDVYNSKLHLIDQACGAIQLDTGFDLNKLIKL